jgi:hypothetical protein
MSGVFLNGKAPPYMETTTCGSLTEEQIMQAAMCLTYPALRTAAAAYFLLMDKIGQSPSVAVEILRDSCTQTAPEGKGKEHD